MRQILPVLLALSLISAPSLFSVEVPLKFADATPHRYDSGNGVDLDVFRRPIHIELEPTLAVLHVDDIARDLSRGSAPPLGSRLSLARHLLRAACHARQGAGKDRENGCLPHLIALPGR